MTSPSRRPTAPKASGTELDLVLAVERTRRGNRRTTRDRLRWDRELRDAYLRGDLGEHDARRTSRRDA